MSNIYTRNAGNTGYIPLTTDNLKIRNAANTGWIGTSNLKVRNAANNGWLSFFSGGGGATITGMSASAMTSVMDISSNGNHKLWTEAGRSAGYGLWADGFPHPYKDASGNVYLPVPHSENFRFRIPDWNNPDGWILEAPTLVSARNVSEGAYNNRHWIFGVWAEGNTVQGLAHHEWYPDTFTINGVGGFNENVYGLPTFNHKWTNAITWVGSSNGGASFTTKNAGNSTQCVLIPEPRGVQNRDHMYGFFHPTNIVKEGSYYYAAVEQRSLGAMVTPENGGPVGFSATSGVSLIRTSNLANSTGWQFWNGSSWTTVSHETYQGNLSSQQPYRFFQSTNHNFYVEPNNFQSGMGHCIRKHTPSGKWVMFGFRGNLGGNFMGYTTTDSLASPNFTPIVEVANTSNLIFLAPMGTYIGVFDPLAAGQNYMEIGNTCTLMVNAHGTTTYKGTLTINVT